MSLKLTRQVVYRTVRPDVMKISYQNGHFYLIPRFPTLKMRGCKNILISEVSLRTFNECGFIQSDRALRENA